jgi:hypothetical protein
MTGMLGVYLTAVELVKRGFIVSPTSRSAMGADLLVTDQLCQQAWSVQVKTNASMANFWLVNAKTKDLVSPTHVYVFVSVPKNPKRSPYFYVVPSTEVARSVKTSPPRKTGSIWHAYYRQDQYRDNWTLFGDPKGSLPDSPASHENEDAET